VSRPRAIFKAFGLLPMAALIFCLHVFGAVWALLGDVLPSSWEAVVDEWRKDS
jgi:hypothetical protein